MDLEADWHFSHVELLARAPTLGVSPVWGQHSGDPYEICHGMAVLGTIVAENNGVGGIGVAPGVTNVRTVSHIHNGERAKIYEAVINAIPLMAPGDVLLIEVQTLTIPGFGYPVEVRDAEFTATQVAVAHGMIVIAAAGNGTRDLDTYSVGGNQILNRAAGPAGGYRDSGAIMVAACQPAVPPARHSRYVDSNYGSRIDCYAWGDQVRTLWDAGFAAGIPNNCMSYGDFVRTSAAAAIIAGAALCVQGVRKAAGGLLSPGQMQALLSDRATGTESVTPATDKIGVMPDLGRVIAQAALMPDVYVRDSLTDDGSVPSLVIGQSPDIIVSGAQVTAAAAQAAWGEGTGFENRDDFGAHVTAGHDAWVHVRLKNRGTNLAARATAQVFWAVPSTLLTPDQWNLIGTTAPIDVDQGEKLVVSPGVLWAKANRPVAAEHCCLIAVVDSLDDPAPLLPPANLPPPAAPWDAFFAFVQAGNNVAWRNVDIVELQNSPLARWAETTPFYFAGAQDKDLDFDFEIVLRLPEGVRAHLRVPTDFTGLCKQGALEAHGDKKEERTVLTLPALRRLPVPSVPIPAGKRFEAQLLLEIAEGVEFNGHSVTIRQRWRGVEVGSLTWRFVPPPPDRVPDDDDDE